MELHRPLPELDAGAEYVSVCGGPSIHRPGRPSTRPARRASSSPTDFFSTLFPGARTPTSSARPAAVAEVHPAATPSTRRPRLGREPREQQAVAEARAASA